jgi:hypothetical protein
MTTISNRAAADPLTLRRARAGAIRRRGGGDSERGHRIPCTSSRWRSHGRWAGDSLARRRGLSQVATPTRPLSAALGAPEGAHPRSV